MKKKAKKNQLSKAVGGNLTPRPPPYRPPTRGGGGGRNPGA